MHYYTYAYLREDKTPYYIGKGQGKRINCKQRIIKPPKDKSRIIFLKQNLTEEEAFKHEIYMIDVFGRKDLGTGILHNRTGGGEGSSGRVPSEQSRKKMSDAHKNPSEETRKRMSEASKGRTHSEETKKRMSEVHKNISEETRRKLSEAHKGKTRSEETRRKISELKKGRKWWNDGCGNRKFVVECPGDCWKPGMK
jgi:hypothetical protein